MTPAERATQAMTETRTRWERERPNRERLAREREGTNTTDAYVCRFDDPNREPMNA